MGLIDKVKTIFWDNEDEEDDIVEAKQPIQPKRKQQEEQNETVNERDLFKSESSFKFPVVFTEEDFAKTIPPEKKVEESPKENKEVRVEERKEQPKEQQKFRLSPAISPIYGVLDKNYKKEDIKAKPTTYRDEKNEISFENVRKKAYGSLSDDIENTLTSNDIRKKIEEKEKNKKKEPKSEENINPNKNITIEEAIASYNEEGLVYSKDNNTEDDIIKLKKDKKSILEDTIEQDLFNLIDSMYDKEENEGDGNNGISK